MTWLVWVMYAGLLIVVGLHAYTYYVLRQYAALNAELLADLESTIEDLRVADDLLTKLTR